VVVGGGGGGGRHCFGGKRGELRARLPACRSQGWWRNQMAVSQRETPATHTYLEQLAGLSDAVGSPALHLESLLAAVVKGSVEKSGSR